MNKRMDHSMSPRGKRMKSVLVAATAAVAGLAAAGCRSSAPTTFVGANGEIYVYFCDSKSETNLTLGFPQTSVSHKEILECKWVKQAAPAGGLSNSINMGTYYFQSPVLGRIGGVGHGFDIAQLVISKGMFKPANATGRGLYVKLGGTNIAYKDERGSGKARVYHDSQFHTEIPFEYVISNGELTVENSAWVTTQVVMAMDTTKQARLEINIPRLKAMIPDYRAGQLVNATIALGESGNALLASSDVDVIEAAPNCGEYRCEVR
ncbi:MAG: hypothetical protein HYV16_01485 [Gammaproteobacteria bacterium]|nr:hypothetical protein [Gammaproteobacteria bacterium]